jgi:hypothetical protein
MDSLIEKYLRDTGIEMKVIKQNGEPVRLSEQEILVHSLLSGYLYRLISLQDLI